MEFVPSDSKTNTVEKVNNCIVEDHSFVRNFLTPAAVQTLTNEYVTVVIMRTSYSRVQLRVHYLETYPSAVPIVELSSPTLPMALLRNKEKECIDKAQEALGKPQFKIIYEHIFGFIQTNLFIPCWKEMKQVATLCEGHGNLGADEKTGILQMRLSAGRYRQTIKLKVPPNYPEDGVHVEFASSNFPSDIQYMFQSQAEEIARRCEAGFSGEHALQSSNPIKMLSKATVNETKIKLTSGNLKNLKHDVNVLKQMSDLRVATARSSKNTYVTQGNAERREARKDLRRLAESELESDMAERDALLEEEQTHMKELMRCKVSETAQPSLFAVARFLVEDYACRLHIEPCQACRKPVLPEDPDSEAVRNSKSEKRAMRTFCGHWLHYECLNEWLTTPPFIRQCPACEGRRIWHPDWPEDHKQLEKAWQNKQARDREMADVSNFMGMGDQFR
jgi:hypothetical protein